MGTRPISSVTALLTAVTLAGKSRRYARGLPSGMLGSLYLDRNSAGVSFRLGVYFRLGGVVVPGLPGVAMQAT